LKLIRESNWRLIKEVVRGRVERPGRREKGDRGREAKSRRGESGSLPGRISRFFVCIAGRREEIFGEEETCIHRKKKEEGRGTKPLFQRLIMHKRGGGGRGVLKKKEEDGPRAEDLACCLISGTTGDVLHLVRTERGRIVMRGEGRRCAVPGTKLKEVSDVTSQPSSGRRRDEHFSVIRGGGRSKASKRGQGWV